jgi:Zn-finger nucleic acid-binding protein
MFTYEVDGATIDECEGCGGIWFDRNEIQKVVDLSGEFESSPAAAATPAPEALRTPVEREEARTCVRCLGRMDRGPIAPGSDAVADFCPRHGLWLDRGAIERLRAFAASGGLGRAGIPLQRATRRPGAWRRHDLSGQGGFPPALALSLLGDAYLGYLAVKHPYRRETGRRRRP